MSKQSSRCLAAALVFAGLALAGCAPAFDPALRPTQAVALPTLPAVTQPAAQPTVTSVPTQAVQPAFSIDPREGLAGSQISISGWDLVPGSEIAVRLGIPQPVGEVLAAGRADANGTFYATITIPANLPSGEPVPLGNVQLVLMDGATNQALASAPFNYQVLDGPTREQASQTVRSFLAQFYDSIAPSYLAGELAAQAVPGQPLHPLLNLPPQGWERFAVGEPLDRPSEVLFVPATLIAGAEHLHYEFTLVVERGEWKINGASLIRTDSPDEPGSIYRELFKADYTGDGIEETYYALKTEIQARASFNDQYLNASAETVGGLLITQPGAHGPFTWLTVDRFGVHVGTNSLHSFAPANEPEAFLLAFDPGSSYLISLLPLRTDGSQHSEPLHINWYDHRRAFGLAPTGNQSEAPSAPDDQTALNIGTVARRYLQQEFPDHPIIAGALAVAGDYAVASAVPAGNEWHTLFLRVAPGAGYEVVYDTIAATAEELRARGIPTSLLQQSEVGDVIGGVIFNTNNPTYGGADGIVTVDGIAAGYARATLQSAPDDEVTIYLRHNGVAWEWLTEGKRFTPADLDQLGIPAELRQRRP